MKKIFALFLLSPVLAFAHPGHLSEGWLAGVQHPFSGWDHLLAMIAVGLWAATFQGKARWLIPTTFVSVMIGGFVLGAQGIQIPMLEQGIAASVLVLGLAAAWLKKVPAGAAMFLVGLFALFHGVAHGAEMGSHGAFSYACGFVMATALLHVAGFVFGTAMSRHQWILRLTGSLIGVIGFSMLFAS
ncbi:MAG: HupE/UreJ family protein [Snodgrassella sp.]|uniref:HupE/UreJ family protein n=1 Tax=Snodgrassella sp. TaxID=2815304 RepID=UPI002583CC46|nr:HupE/UreJ family protein [Snodgrassella sp.]MCO6514715.1 HupE/UreJ family protein [Snodgrassella sp.]